MNVLQQVLAENPSDRRAKASLADLYYRTGKLAANSMTRNERFREAMTLAGQILREDPDDPRALVVMGNVLLDRKKPREAMEYFRLALGVAVSDYLWARVARCHLDMREPLKALEVITQGETSYPSSYELLRLRTESVRALKDASAEREAFRKAARLAPAEAKGFASFVMPLLAGLAPRRAALISESLRETPGQELNPHLLLFEAQSYLNSRDPGMALSRLDSLLQQAAPVPLCEEATQLKELAEEILGEGSQEQKG
jgi:tetratricopeptide (TPR) repeat protein